MSTESYPCYVKIGDEKSGPDEMVELPTENDGRILLSTIQAQYPEAIGLRFKSESGGWRGVGLSQGVLDPPLEGWGDYQYYITVSKTGGKRKFGDSDGPGGKAKKMSDKEMLSDLIVLGLPYAATEEDMKTYFETFGELDMYEIKMDPQTKKSRGFGFIRFKTVEAVEAVLEATHTIMGRKCEVRFPKKEGGQGGGVPTKLFIGRLARGTTIEDLREHFSGYGALTDVYIPPQFRGFGFVTFESQDAAQEVLNRTHVIKDTYVNVTFPTPKGGQQQPQQQQMQQQNMGMQQQQYGYGSMQGQQGQGYGNQQGQGYGMQGTPGQGYGMQGTPGQGYGNQGSMGYSNQGNTMNSYFQQPTGKMQGGKMTSYV